MNLVLPLQDQTTDVDYTTVDNLIFSKDMSGIERMQLIASVFSTHYKVNTVNGRMHSTVKDAFVRISDKVVISLRAYKHIVVCIVGTTTSGFGPSQRASAASTKRLFEENNRVFPFRAVLEKVREYKKVEDAVLREKELKDQETELKYLQLEGILLMDLNIPNNKMSRVNLYEEEIKINITLPNSGYGSWNKTSISLRPEDDNLDIVLSGGLPYRNVSLEDAKSIFKPLFEYTFDKL